MLRTLIYAALGIALAGCQTAPKPSPSAHYFRDDTGRYEIRLDYTFWSPGGGPCNTLQLFPEKADSTDCIYTRSMDGEVPADQLVLIADKGALNKPVPVSGSVTFTRNHMHVALQRLPTTNPSPSDRRGAYELNGDYNLRPDESMSQSALATQPTTR